MFATNLADLELYVALGDSLSIDLPTTVRKPGREGGTEASEAGAASLLHRNRDRTWREFVGRDLASHRTEIRYFNFAMRRATMESVLHSQIERLPTGTGKPAVVTLTAGGNDLLALKALSEAEGRRGLNRSIDQLQEIVTRLRLWSRRSTIILSTVYDPSDGAAQLGDGIVMRREWEWLRVYNAALRELALAEGCRLADLHRHFLGHGLSEPDPARRWYVGRPLLEPNARGASEIRRIWLSVLEYNQP